VQKIKAKLKQNEKSNFLLGQLPANAQPAAGGVGLMSSLRGGAGTLIHKLRDTSKAVIQSVSVGGRGLDLVIL